MSTAQAGPGSSDPRSSSAVAADAPPVRSAPTSRAPERVRTWWVAHGLTCYLALTYLLGVVTVVTLLLSAEELEVSVWRLLGVVVLSAFADLPLLERRIGHSVESLNFAELCVILSIALLPLPYAVLIAAACVLVFDVARRIALSKALFNTANFTIAMTLAGLAAHAVARGDLDEATPRSLAGLLLGTFVFFLVNSSGVALAVSLSQRSSFFSVYRQGLHVRLVLAGINALIALLVIVLADWSYQTVVVLPPVLAALYASYHGYLTASQERDVWQQLDSVTRELNSLDLRTVVDASLSRSAQLFRADAVHLVLEDATSSTVYTGDARGLLRTCSGPAEQVPQQVDGSLMVYAAPLEGPQGRLGVLRLCFSGPVQLRRREQQVLRTLAHSISTTLQNARLYGEMRQHAEDLAYEASHDALTGLGNRVLLQDRASAALRSRPDEACGLLIVDLDHFKEINDTLGHAAGDLLLGEVARRVTAAVPHAEAVCRLGGDEFAVLLVGLAAPEDADAQAAELLRVLAEPVVVDGLRLSVEGSLGVACYPADASSFEELLQRADVALYQAKEARGSFAHYRAERDESSLHRLALAAELRTALADEQFVVHFQPQVELASGEMTGVEALVRWKHPTRGLLAPGQFVSAVEHSELIRDFTLTVLDLAVAEVAAWSRAGRPLSVAVNLSARNLLDRELPADVARVLARHGLPPERLVLEITETTMMSELDVVEDVLAQLRRMSVELSVDDFGTGYSSLAFLQRVRVNEVKVDRSFVSGVTTSDASRALVRATVQLAHALGARAVGEGVEDVETADVLRELGCDLAQGYSLGRPMPAPDLRRRLGLVEAPGGALVPRRGSDGRHLRAVVGPC